MSQDMCSFAVCLENLINHMFLRLEIKVSLFVGPGIINQILINFSYSRFIKQIKLGKF